MIENIHYSVSSTAYECDDNNWSFGESNVYDHCGNQTNSQDILYNGQRCGIVREHSPWNVLQPMDVCFMFFVGDDEFYDHPNFVEDEWNHFSFATMQMFSDWCKSELGKEVLKKNNVYLIAA